MDDFDDLVDDLKKTRDELRLKMHLASMEAREEWDGLEDKWRAFAEKAEVQRSSRGVGEALDQLGRELGQAYTRFRKALTD